MLESIQLTKDVFRIDARAWCEEIEIFIQERFSESFREGIAVTISGGLDSSVTAALCTQAIGKDKVIGLMLPEKWGNPDADHFGKMMINHLNIAFESINITPILRGLGTSDFLLSLTSGRERWKRIVNKLQQNTGHPTQRDYLESLEGKLDPWRRKMIAKVNSKHRARLLATYKYADEHNLMVVGSAHKTEHTVGLFCKYGIDDCADIMPLGSIYRSHILQLAEYLGVPTEIINRPPNPDILPGVTDKYLSYFDLNYLQVDLILWGLEHSMTTFEIAMQMHLNEQKVRQMQKIIVLSQNTRNHALAPDMRNV